MKKLLAFILVITMVFAMSSCTVIDNIVGAITGTTTITPNAHLYNDFTYSEKTLIKTVTGGDFPFLANDQYYVEEYSYEYTDDGIKETGFIFETVGNTAEEFEAYRALFSGYTFEGSDADESGDVWYSYTAADESYFVDMVFYVDDGENIVDVCVYYCTDIGGDGGDNITGEGFTSAEKALIKNITGGALIPFLSAEEYCLEEYTDSETYASYGITEYGVNYYTFGNTQAEFDAYRAQFSSYTLDETDTDDYGDTWYYYSAADESYYVDMSYYQNKDGDYVVDVYVYYYADSDEGGNGGNGGTTSDVDLITNDGEGLPEGTDGVFAIDFKKAEYVKNVTEQGYYADGCPTTGSPAVLVIPVEFSDVTAESKGYTIDKLVNAFGKDGKTDYYSVYDYYYISSYTQLTLDVTVLDEWFRPSQTSTYYAKQTYNYGGQEIEIGDQMIIDEALAYLEDKMDLTKFDSDGNGFIDSIVLINTLDISSDDNFHWAYRYWNIYADDDGNYYEYDEVCANDYLWASYQFLYETTDESNNTVYDSSVMNTYTYIHEFGHVLGLDDYYDTSGNTEGPLNGCDVMDYMLGDHSAYSKFNLGWITTSRLVTTDSSVTLTLEDFSKSGDTLIIANNWSEKLGAYQEYYILVYYKNTGLNAHGAGYFSRDGVVVYHINSTLYSEVYDGVTYYDVYNNNTDASDSSGYGTSDNLIELVKSANDTYTYIEGDTMPTTKDDSGNVLGINFVVDSLTDDSVTITFYNAK